MDIEIKNTEHGHLAKPKGQGPFAAVIVIHEWWGLNDHIKDITRRLASEGIAALAPDLFGGKVTADPEEAGRLMNALTPDAAMRIIERTFYYLQSLQEIKKDRIGITGFCMGGSFALLAACRIPELAFSAPFYGHYPENIEEIKNIHCPVLFFAGAKDQWINGEVVKKIENAFSRHGIKGEIQRYEDADHAFFNDTRPEVYHAKAAQDAWRRLLQFIK